MTRLSFIPLKNGNYKIIRKIKKGREVFIIKEHLWWIFYTEVKRSEKFWNLKRDMDSYVKLGI